MKNHNRSQILTATVTIATMAPAVLLTSFADDPKIESDQTELVEEAMVVEIEPGGILIESDGEIVEFQTGVGKKKMSINLSDLLGKNSAGIGDTISKLVEAHPEQAGKLAQSFLGGSLKDLFNHDSSSLSELMAEGIESAPYYIGVEVEAPGAVVLSQLELAKGTSLVVKQVVKDSPADKAGFQKYDLLTTSEGVKLGSREDLVALVLDAGKNEKPLQLVRISKGKRTNVSLTPAKREANAFGTTFLGQGVLVPKDEKASSSELKAVQEELSEQRKMLESILSKLGKENTE